MVRKGALGTYKPGKPSSLQVSLLFAALAIVSLGCGYMAATQPPDAGWRFFSWHPFLMTTGMVGLTGVSAVTKKLGGYTNTKVHGIIAWTGLMCSFGGLYIIYKNKENNGKPHFTSNHAWAGLFCLANCVGLGLAGGIVLHPDFGIDKTNKTIRLVHKTFARLVLMLAWATAFLGLFELTQEPMTLATYGVPLLLLIPFTLM